jgi:hypothetical protein
MSRRSVRTRRLFCLPVAWVVAAMILASCGQPAAVVEPPQVPEGLSGIVLNASPGDLALTRLDMPAGFQLAAERSSDLEYVALYLRPSALQEGQSGGNKLLSVLTSVGVYTTTVDAERVYREATAVSTHTGVEEAAMITKGATNVAMAPFDGAVVGADASEAYQVTYELMGQGVYEYGHRFRLGNVVVYVVVAAVGDPDEPEHLIRDVRDLAQRQIDHIVAAVTKGPAD